MKGGRKKGKERKKKKGRGEGGKGRKKKRKRKRRREEGEKWVKSGRGGETGVKYAKAGPKVQRALPPLYGKLTSLFR